MQTFAGQFGNPLIFAQTISPETYSWCGTSFIWLDFAFTVAFGSIFLCSFTFGFGSMLASRLRTTLDGFVRVKMSISNGTQHSVNDVEIMKLIKRLVCIQKYGTYVVFILCNFLASSHHMISNRFRFLWIPIEYQLLNNRHIQIIL